MLLSSELRPSGSHVTAANFCTRQKEVPMNSIGFSEPHRPNRAVFFEASPSAISESTLKRGTCAYWLQCVVSPEVVIMCFNRETPIPTGVYFPFCRSPSFELHIGGGGEPADAPNALLAGWKAKCTACAPRMTSEAIPVDRISGVQLTNASDRSLHAMPGPVT